VHGDDQVMERFATHLKDTEVLMPARGDSIAV
jgi:hypothetical protein